MDKNIRYIRRYVKIKSDISDFISLSEGEPILGTRRFAFFFAKWLIEHPKVIQFGWGGDAISSYEATFPQFRRITGFQAAAP